MARTPVWIEYNRELKALEEVLAGVRRPGDFFVGGRLETPMPKVTVEGADVLSFPVPANQIDAIVREATLAPYGRGEETLLDTSVRKVWQVSPAKVRLGGRSWPGALDSILARVREGLGCGEAPVTAELYKLLVYDEGGFFKAHRDTEKSPGMFGTLVIALPSFHCGGELILRHAGREVTLELSTTEVSELTFAAFYADCEHEVLPVTEGARVCLVYNLIQQRRGKGRSRPLLAPEYQAEVDQAAAILKQALPADSSPLKIAWLLEHQYSPAGLSFTGLKNADAGRAKVLSEAASRAGCSVHLAVVHIEESGPAEPLYDDYYGGGFRWGHSYHDEDEEEEEEDADGEDFEIIEVSDSEQYLDRWVNLEDRPADFGRVPLAEGELLPAGALDDEPPDDQRLMEATGNEGASFERSYHRAAVVIWRRDRYAEVLLQAGAGAALPYLRERIENSPATLAAREEVVSLANLIIEAWRGESRYDCVADTSRPGNRAAMLELLDRLGDADTLARFITEVVIPSYDGSENEALAAGTRLLGAARTGRLFSRLCTANMRRFHVACVELLRRAIEERGATLEDDWRDALRETARSIVAGMGEIGISARDEDFQDWERSEKVKPVNPVQLADLLDKLAQLRAEATRESAATAIAAGPKTFDPGKIVIPALELLRRRHGESVRRDDGFRRLWNHGAEFLLARSERPPAPPKDWRQDVKLSCNCEDCRELQAFARNPEEQTHRFRVRKDRRRHLHQTIDHHKLDMTHVTERTGSPHTLVCTKTRRTYERRCRQYREDVSSMSSLVRLMSRADDESAVLSARLKAAAARAEG